MAKRHTKPLQDASIKKLMRLCEKNGVPKTKSDGDGLTITISKHGYAAWILRYGRAGRRREITIGPFPAISVAEARKIATKHRANISQGIDVAADKKRTLKGLKDELTVSELADDYIAVDLNSRRRSTAKLYGGYIRRWVLPSLGSLPVNTISSRDIVGMLEAAKGHGRGALRTLLAATRNIFTHGLGKGKVTRNPAEGIKLKSILAPQPRRKAVALEGEELGRFLRALPDDPSGWAFRLHLMTGVRPAELLEAPWREFALSSKEPLWTIPDERTKTKKGYAIRLPRQALEILQKLKKGSGTSAFLFPAAYGTNDRPIPYQTYRGRLRVLLATLGDDFPRIKAHDLRRTMRTGLAKLKIRYEVAERAINHKLPDLTDIYELNDYQAERHEALRRWANYLDQLEMRDQADIRVKLSR